MAHPNEDRFRAGYAAFQTGDMEALANEYFTPDVVWHSPGRNPLSGDAKGLEEVLGNFAKAFDCREARSASRSTIASRTTSTAWCSA